MLAETGCEIKSYRSFESGLIPKQRADGRLVSIRASAAPVFSILLTSCDLWQMCTGQWKNYVVNSKSMTQQSGFMSTAYTCDAAKYHDVGVTYRSGVSDKLKAVTSLLADNKSCLAKTNDESTLTHRIGFPWCERALLKHRPLFRHPSFPPTPCLHARRIARS